MGAGARSLAALCLLGVLCSAHGDLTARLVDDSEHLANIVGAKETESLVNYRLKKVRISPAGWTRALGRRVTFTLTS